ncbi:MAG: MotA/TolQ/ExbB proton channel family protein [Clostridia bacterium]|nr:MotA/TolQ/ExbB proton channel family protein [Clostridia bacterium]
MTEILDSLAANLTDFLVYLAIAMVAVIGIAKCVLPVRRAARRLRRGVHSLEVNTGDGHPVWQDALFLGKEMQGPWKRFLVNAEQLDARGLNCNVEDYVNDDTVIYAVGHAQLAEVVPGLLTSLGILGTFIGLMRGLSGLDLNDAAKTMESIPQLIGGMTYAFTTSIAGVACSLLFNMLNRMAYGSATRAIDDFNDAFTDLVMQKPLDDSVQLICQQEDRSAMLRRMSGDLSARISDGILSSVQQSLVPVAQSMNQFILGQTQTQIEGVNNIVNQFIAQMNRSLGNQFVQLGQTLSAVNQAQTVSYDSLERTMASADQILTAMNQVQNVTQRVMERFESYIGTIDQAQDSSAAFLTHGSQVLSGIMTASQEQAEFLKSMKDAQQDLQKTMQDYAVWSTGVLNTVREQNDGAFTAAGRIAGQMEDSSVRLADTYTSFVEDISGGFSRALGMFDENVHSVLNAMNEKLDELKAVSAAVPDQAARYQKETEGCVAAVAQLQRALTDMSAEIEKMTRKAGDA